MNETKFFLIEAKRTTEKTFDKGVVVKDSFESAKQGYHAYLGAYAYGNNIDTEFVFCMIADMSGTVLMSETWQKNE